MAKQVFISHSSKDKEMAEIIYNYLTSQGIKCWIDFHDIRPGIAYAREIMRGIDGSDALVVVYSKNVNTSEDILNEIDQFHAAHKSIIPFLIDKTPFSRELDYYLKRRQWIIANDNYRQHLPSLRDALAEILQLELPRTGQGQQNNTNSQSRQDTQANKDGQLFDVVLLDAGDAKLKVVKAVKEACALGLKEAKDSVDNTPCILPGSYDYNKAIVIMKAIEQSGASVRIKKH